MKINQKNVKEYYAKNVSAFFVTSNDRAAIALEPDDRRFLVVVAGDKVRPWDKARYAALADWMRTGGRELAAEWLARRWDTMIDARRSALLGTAPMTTGKATMIAMAEDPVRSWIRTQVDDGGWPDLMTTEDVRAELVAAARDGGHGFRHVPGPKIWGSALKDLGAQQVCNGAHIRAKQGGKARVWAIRSPERFLGVGEGKISQLYASERTGAPDAGGKGFGFVEDDDNLASSNVVGFHPRNSSGDLAGAVGAVGDASVLTN